MPTSESSETPRARRLDALRPQIESWLRENPSLSVRQMTELLAPYAPSVSERTVRRYLADYRAVHRSHNGTDGPVAEASDGGGERTVLVPHAPGAGARTPADPTPAPVSTDAGFDLDAPELYLNRELTWLNFNFRVLHEAEDPRTPLLERVKFLAIVGSNLDEFFMKRIGGLKQQVGAEFHERTIDGRTPEQQIAECFDTVRLLEDRMNSVLRELSGELEREGIGLADWSDLSEAERLELRTYYVENIYPLVTPQATDPAHPFPFISNLSLNLLVSLRSSKDDLPSLARVKVPIGVGIPRLLRIGSADRFVRMESVMAQNLDLLFPGMDVEHVAAFRVTRNANTEQDEETAEDLLELIQSELRDRRFAAVVRLEVESSMTSLHRGMLAAELDLDEDADVFEREGMLGMSDLMELLQLQRPDLRDPQHHPVDHPELITDRNIFHVIRDAGSILLHHPYISFSTSVERFLREASRDPKVRAIKMCLYRTSSDTKAIQYLVDAARNGKQVAVVVELKARFDEEANIRWANRMEQAGIHVTYGVVGLKTHCKTILVVRQDYNGLRRYAHVGTGNYHAGTARLYSDLGLLTSDPDLGKDLTELFNYLTTGYRPKRLYHKLLPAPKLCRIGLLKRIRREIDLQAEGVPGRIQFKLNALEDPEITRALYEASMAGVQVDLIIRDTCRLRPGIPGLSENVRVISIVGRFLEHARVYCFQNGGAEEYYIGSADAMRRNLNSRVEILSPVEDDGMRAELRHFLDLQLADDTSAWEMQPDGSYVQRQPVREDSLGSQEALIEWHKRRLRDTTRLRRRRPRGGPLRRNVRQP